MHIFDVVVYIPDIVVYILDIVVYILDIVENKLHKHPRGNFPAWKLRLPCDDLNIYAGQI